jgi:hypothetical protein
MNAVLRAAGAVLAVLVLTAAQAPPNTETRLRFVVLGHLRGDANGELLANLAEVVESVRREDPDLVFLCGDLIWGDIDGPSPTDPAIVRADWERLDAALLGLGAPTYRVPGNHDVCDVATRDVWRERYGPLPRAVTFGNSRFLLLNSSWWPEDDSRAKHPQDKVRGVALDASQIAFVRTELEHSSEVQHVFLFLHHLLWWEDGAPWWKRVAPLFQDRPVRAVFSGDYGPMKFAHLLRGDVHYLQTSVENKVSMPMLRGREASRMLSSQFDNYLVVDVDGPEVRYSVRAVGALSTGKFSPARYRDVFEYDKDTYGRKLLRRWSTSDRLVVGLLQLSALAFAAGALSVITYVFVRRFFTRRRS